MVFEHFTLDNKRPLSFWNRVSFSWKLALLDQLFYSRIGYTFTEIIGH